MSTERLPLQAKTQIFILSRDRVNFCRVAIAGAVLQDANDFEVIVSDNSIFDDVGQMVRTEFPEVIYVRRCGSLPALEHFRTVITESTAEEIVLFHDDDQLAGNYLSTMRAVLEQYPQAAAVASDAWIIRGDTYTTTRFMRGFKKSVELRNAEELLLPYMRFGNHRAAPFSGYLYRRKFVSDLYLNQAEGGKHADVAFLMNIISRAPIIWVSEPLMYYRMHRGSDSAIEEVGQRLRLLRYVYSKTNITPRSDCVQEFRFRYWVRWFRHARKSLETNRDGWKYRIVRRYLIVQGFRFLLLKPSIWMRASTAAR